MTNYTAVLSSVDGPAQVLSQGRTWQEARDGAQVALLELTRYDDALLQSLSQSLEGIKDHLSPMLFTAGHLTVRVQALPRYAYEQAEQTVVEVSTPEMRYLLLEDPQGLVGVALPEAQSRAPGHPPRFLVFSVREQRGRLITEHLGSQEKMLTLGVQAYTDLVEPQLRAAFEEKVHRRSAHNRERHRVDAVLVPGYTGHFQGTPSLGDRLAAAQLVELLNQARVKMQGHVD